MDKNQDPVRQALLAAIEEIEWCHTTIKRLDSDAALEPGEMRLIRVRKAIGILNAREDAEGRAKQEAMRCTGHFTHGEYDYCPVHDR